MRLPRILLAMLATTALVVGFMPTAHADDTTATYIVELKAGVSAQAVIPSLLGSDAKILDKAISGGIAFLTAVQAKALESNPYVKSVRQDTQVSTSATRAVKAKASTGTVSASAIQTNAPWDLDILDSANATLDGNYTAANDGNGVTVYVVDTGLYRASAQFANITVAAGAGFGVANPDSSDCDGQGTGVASLIAGSTLGAAKGVTLVPLRVLDCNGSGSASDLIDALNYVLVNHKPGAPAVVNIGLGIEGVVFPELDTAVQNVINAGITVVVAAEFNNVDACQSSPGRVPAAITVAASTLANAEATGTSYGSCIDLYAPGQDVSIADITGSTSTATGWGTAYSAGIVAAIAAQVLHANPSWTPAQVWTKISALAVSGKITGARSANKLAGVGSTYDSFVKASPGGFMSLSPSRLLDTRVTGPKLGSAQTRSLQVTGVGGVPTTGVSAVVLNVTVTETTSNGYLTVSPTGTPRPVVSNLNWSTGATIPNAVTVKVGTGGSIDLYQSGPGTAQVIVDVAGYYVNGTVTDPGGFTSITPARILDTRNVGGKLTSTESRDLQILGAGGVPASNVSAVVLNVTVTDTTSNGYLTVYPSGTARPTASNLNWSPGLTIPNLVVVKVGGNGKVSLYQSGPGTAQVIADVAGYYLGGTATQPGMFVALSPARVLDTRNTSAVPAASDLALTILGKGGIPTTGVSAVVINTTVTDTKAPGYLTVFPGTTTLPTASNLNWSGPGTTIPNLVTVQVGSNGSIKFHNGSGGTTQVVADTAGYYIGT